MESRRGNTSALLAAVAALLAAVAGLLAACARTEPPTETTEHEGGKPSERRGDPHAPGGNEGKIHLRREALGTIGFETAPVSRRRLSEAIRTTATVEANAYRLAHVSPRIPGRAIDVRASLGQEVEAGEILAELDSLELGERKAAFLEARTNLEVARRNYERERRLFEQDISSEKEVLEARGEFERRAAGYRAAREALRLVGLSDAEIDRIAWSRSTGEPLSRFPLVSPIAGTVLERHLTTGELVGPEDKPFTIGDLGTVWVILDIHESDLARVRVGDPAQVAVDAYPGETFEGTLAYLGSVVEPETRTTRARLEIPNPGGRLRPGMFARVTVVASAGEGREALAVPPDAVQTVGGKPVVFVVDENPDVFVVREISLGERAGDFVEVRSGLREGERVVTKGAFYLKSALLAGQLGGDSD
jgi:cobalt-zinc-cadmium efflux system membrane fusion protein